jgi:hypothetical protein
MAFFVPEHERLPLSLGWCREKEAISLTTLTDMMDRLTNATGATAEQAAKLKRHAGLHAGQLPVER